MMPCILIGDSIAVGVGQTRPECETVAQVGITSERYVTTMLPPGRTRAETAVISLGVNDDTTVPTLDNLRTVRARIFADRVVWLLPGIKEHVRGLIQAVAAENGDRTLDTRPWVGRDNLHPNGAGYEVIAARTLGEAAGTGVEVAYAPAYTQAYTPAYATAASEDLARPLRRGASQAERVRRLRAIRHAEVHRAPAHTQARSAPRFEPRPELRTEFRAEPRRRAGAVPSRAPALHTDARALRHAEPRLATAPAARTKVAAGCARPCREKARIVRS